MSDFSFSSTYLLRYIPAHSMVYLANKDVQIFGYALSLTLIEYQTAVLQGDLDGAAEILPSIPKEQRNKVARFLESRGIDHYELFHVVRSNTGLRFEGARIASNNGS